MDHEMHENTQKLFFNHEIHETHENCTNLLFRFRVFRVFRGFASGFPDLRRYHVHGLVFDAIRGDPADGVVGIVRAGEDTLEMVVPNGLFRGLVGQDLGQDLAQILIDARGHHGRYGQLGLDLGLGRQGGAGGGGQGHHQKKR